MAKTLCYISVYIYKHLKKRPPYRSTACAGARPAWAWPAQRGGWHRRSFAKFEQRKFDKTFRLLKATWNTEKLLKSYKGWEKDEKDERWDETKWNEMKCMIESYHVALSFATAKSLQKLYNSIRRAWTELLQTCWINRFWQIYSWYLADHACWDAPASVQSQFPEGCDRAKTCQDKSAGMNSRRYLRPLYSNVLHTFPYHLHGSAKGIRDKCCLCLSRCKNRNAACVVFKHENQQEINYFMLKETPTHHSRIVHAQHKRLHVFTILKNYLPHPRRLDWLRF